MNEGKMLLKGNRVKFEFKGETKYGIVTKGGRKDVLVVLDGGINQVKGNVGWFELSTQPLPVDKPNEMDKYSLKGFKELKNGHGDSRTFSATILEDGNPILIVRNDGWGGGNEYQPFDWKKDHKGQHKRFYTAVRSWATQFGYPEMMEPDDAWVEWWQYQRPFGVLAETYIREEKEEMTRLTGK